MAERFFLPHNPVKGRQGGQPPGFLVSQACSPLGPVRMFPPPAAGGGCSLVPKEAWREEVFALLVGADSRQLTGGRARLGGGALGASWCRR